MGSPKSEEESEILFPVLLEDSMLFRMGTGGIKFTFL